MSGPSWEDLKADREHIEPEMPADHPVRALARIGDTADGKILIAFLNRKMRSVPPSGASDSALREEVAERRLTQILLNHLERNSATRTDARRNTLSKQAGRSRAGA